MPSADKRQRKKENARQARAAREAAAKRSQRMKTGRNVGIVVVLVVIVVVLINVFSNNKSNKKSSTTSTTTTAPAAAALPAGCTSTAPKASTKPTNLKAPGLVIDPTKTYTATIETSCGNVVIALDAKDAPKSVNNFVYLAKMGFYDGLKFHRVANDPPVVQGGDPKGDGSGGPGYTTTVELPKDGKYPAGAVAWAKGGSDPDGSAGSQFFIDTADASSIGNHYGYIGKVSSGMENVQKMTTQVQPNDPNGTPAHPLYIEKVTITES